MLGATFRRSRRMFVGGLQILKCFYPRNVGPHLAVLMLEVFQHEVTLSQLVLWMKLNNECPKRHRHPLEIIIHSKRLRVFNTWTSIAATLSSNAIQKYVQHILQIYLYHREACREAPEQAEGSRRSEPNFYSV